MIPILAIPISLIGTFFVMGAAGFSINNLSLFGLVLAIGIVVDDAIVVVENVERNIAAGLAPRDAARKTMDEVGGALVSIALVLCAVFIPSMFITGISGQFYRQFALTIASATVISLVVSLTLSPAMCAVLLKPHDPRHRESWWERPHSRLLPAVQPRIRGAGARIRLRGGAGRAHHRRHADRIRRHSWLRAQRVLAHAARIHPAAGPRLPDRRRPVAAGGVAGTHRHGDEARPPNWCAARPGVGNVVNIVGFSGATFTNAPNAGAMFVILDPYASRTGDPSKTAAAIQGALFGKLAAIQKAFMIVVLPPPVQGIGNASGFRMMI